MKKQLLYIGMAVLLCACMNDESIYEKERLDLNADQKLSDYINKQGGVFVVN